MAVDKFNNPFIYASKVGGFFYEMSSDPENDEEVDWPDEMEFNGNMVEMFPDGPTDFGIGPHARDGPEAIGGCDMEYADAAARGYMYQPDDPRDIEFKMEAIFHDIDSGFSISADTARHTSDNCCQGNAYMANMDTAADPDGDQFRFRKEQWHVHYVDTGWFNHPSINFVVQDHGKVGFCFIRFNKPNTPGHVVLEMWMNPTPDTNKNNWIKLKTEEDFAGHGFGDAGDTCGGPDDAPLTWGGPQSRAKTNSTGGSVEFSCISLREIDPTRDIDDNPPPPPTCPAGQIWNGTACVPVGGPTCPAGQIWNGTACVPTGGGPPPPTPGGGGTINPIITYCASSSFTTSSFDTIPTYVPLSNTTLILSEEIVECMINPDRFKRFGNYGWVRDTTDREGADIGDRPCDFGVDLINIKTYPSGLVVETYWDEAGQICVCPGVGNGTPGGPTGQDTILIISANRSDTADDGNPWEYSTPILSHEIVESISDPITRGTIANHLAGIVNETTVKDSSEISDVCQTDFQFVLGGDSIWVQGYWSVDDNKCICHPTLYNKDSGADTNFTDAGGRVLDHAVIFLIFWGKTWKTKTSSPNATQLINKVQNILLGSAVSYFDDLQQYRVTNRPVWGGAIFNDITPVPSQALIGVDTVYQVVEDCITKGLTPRPPAVNQNVYNIILPDNKNLGTGIGGYHFDAFADNLTSPSGNAIVARAALTDTNGIQWLQATGPIIGWGISRDDPGDFRWSNDTENAGLGYEVTWIVRVSNMTSNGHTALKAGGPNHSGDCGGGYKEDGQCCCWYDLGIRANGNVQTQIERPHPNNSDWDCDQCTMSNIGVAMNGNWIGIKLILYPEKPGGTAEDGGIRIKMYKDSNAMTGSVPTNNWQLVVDMVDNGEILGDGYEWPLYQELEMRLSDVDDVDDVEMYKDQVFMRRLIGSDSGGGGGGGGNTDGVYNHGGRMMHNPKIQTIFWGADWNTRSITPTKSEIIDHLQNKLLGTNVTFFSKLAQYGAPGVPTWLTPVVNTTVPHPTATHPTVANIETVIKQSLESGLCPIPADFLNTIFIVLPMVDYNILVPTTTTGGATESADYRYRDCFKPVITLPGGGGGGTGGGGPTTAQGVFKLMRDINIQRVSACAGGTSEGGGGGGGGSGTSVFYDVTGTASEKEISNESGSDNRTQISEKVNISGAVMNGKTPKQADVMLRKETGTTATTPLVYFKIWDASGAEVYVSPTTFTPNSLTTSHVAKTFDLSTNTHALVVGDRVGCEFTGTDPAQFVWTAYQTSEGTGSSGSYSVYKEGSAYDNQTSRRMSMKLYS